MTDIMERLRDPRFTGFPREGIAAEAADEIERLRGENKNLKMEIISLLDVTVGGMSPEEIKRDYGMLGWSIVKRCEALGERDD